MKRSWSDEATKIIEAVEKHIDEMGFGTFGVILSTGQKLENETLCPIGAYLLETPEARPAPGYFITSWGLEPWRFVYLIVGYENQITISDNQEFYHLGKFLRDLVILHMEK